jgi:hypothetical protein
MKLLSTGSSRPAAVSSIFVSDSGDIVAVEDNTAGEVFVLT